MSHMLSIDFRTLAPSTRIEASRLKDT